MKVHSDGKSIILSEVHSFDLYHTFECGQCFRWNKIGEKCYTGTAFGKALTIEEKDNIFILYDTSMQDFENIWYNYFDFSTDYQAIKNNLKKDAVMEKAIAAGSGIRILRQELWETVVSFIISASNNIPRIKKIIAALCENFGTPFEYRGEIHYSFPAPEKIASLSLEDLSVIKAGFRDKYILDAAHCFISRMHEHLTTLSSSDAKKELMRIKGVGNKVADCVMLFGLHDCASFPVDVWIKRIMEYCYFDNKQSINSISTFARDKFGEYGGYAQQYLFFYARENKIEGDKN